MKTRIVRAVAQHNLCFGEPVCVCHFERSATNTCPKEKHKRVVEKSRKIVPRDADLGSSPQDAVPKTLANATHSAVQENLQWAQTQAQAVSVEFPASAW